MSKINKMISILHIHPLLWGVIFLGVITGSFIELSIIFLLIFTHEMGHLLMALFFRWRIKRVMFWPFGGVMESDEYFSRPYKEEFIVLLAGPFQHIWIHSTLLILLEYGIFPAEIMEYALTYNIALFLFNLLPIYPLDGGKLLFLVLSYPFPFSRVLKLTILFSTIFTIFGLLIIFLNHWLTIHTLSIACFLLIENRLEWKQRQYVFLRHLLARYKNDHTKELIQKPLSVHSATPVYEVLKLFRKGYYHVITFVNKNSESITIDEKQALQAFFEWKKPYEKVESISKIVKT
jgi:stage IV sporulation protein FB